MLRPATANDQPRITSMVRAAGIFPLDLKWQRFIVAEENGQIVGAGQLKEHASGARELASLVVVPERRRSGIAGQIINAILARASGPLYLFCHFTGTKPSAPQMGGRRWKWLRSTPPT